MINLAEQSLINEIGYKLPQTINKNCIVRIPGRLP